MSPRLGIVALLVIATVFGANHVAARVAIDHGASVAAAVTARSGFTAVVLLCLLKGRILSAITSKQTLLRVMMVGVFVAIQSFCLYSAVARIPVALALLVFQTFPMLFMLLSWAAGKETPHASALLAMPLALAGLALALDVKIDGFAGRWEEIGAGVLWALGAAVSFTLVFFFNAHWLKALDGRTRTFFMMTVTAALVLSGGAAAGAIAWPADGAGWLALALLTVLYGSAITSLFVILPRLSGAESTVALNFEPIAVLGIAWLALGQAVSPLQILGAFIVVGVIAWLGAAKR